MASTSLSEAGLARPRNSSPPSPPTTYRPQGSFSHIRNNSSRSNKASGTTAASKSTAAAAGAGSNTENVVLHAHRQNHNSSKLPAFRFADRLGSKKEGLVPPTLLQHMPPSPISPNPEDLTATPTSPINQVVDGPLHDLDQHIHASSPPSTHHHRDLPLAQDPPLSPPRDLPTPDRQNLPESSRPSRKRSSTLQSTSTNEFGDVASPQRPVSYPESPSAAVAAAAAATTTTTTGTVVSQSSSLVSPTTTRPPQRRATGPEASTRPPPSLDARRLQAVEIAQQQEAEAQLADESTKEWAQGQRELLLPKTIDSAKPDDKRKSRPPLSFRSPSISNVASNRAVIPPIRSFRSSGSRKSLVLDMHSRRVSDSSSYGEDVTDPNVRDRTLRALEGRGDDDYSHITPPDSADVTPDNDNTADLFMRIAHDDPGRRPQQDPASPGEEPNAMIRVARTSSKRPVSAAIPPPEASPPQVIRRHSDQVENSKNRTAPQTQPAQQMTRELGYRTLAKDRSRPPITMTTIDYQSARTPLRPSPITPRQISFQDEALQSLSAYSRRRSSVTDTNSTVARGSQYRASNLTYVQGRTYNSSPLVPKVIDAHRQEGGVEGTESSASTAAPSTVWDELDDLKSRINRLELTGKIPPSSAAAMSRVSDDRPPTATTNATTMSASPKRTAGINAPPPDAVSTVSMHKETQPILMSALAKTKAHIAPEIFAALESATTDALALSTMMGTVGQPGPISSGASAVGAGGSVTDRQLRRKTESLCRGLTELCLALAEEGVRASAPPALAPPALAPPAVLAQPVLPPLTLVTPQKEQAASPSVTRFPGSAGQRRGSAIPGSVVSGSALSEQHTLVRPNTSPRGPTTLEQRRYSTLNAPALSSPRFAHNPLPPPSETPTAGRKSSLLISRTRRAGTEEPEEPTDRKSSLLRTRRAGTEEPEERPEGRKTSLLIRSRRAVAGEDEDEIRYRVPSRANTELNSPRPSRELPSSRANAELSVPRLSRELPPSQIQTSTPDASPAVSATVSRRRLLPSSLNSKLISPMVSALGARRYLERSTPERDTSSVVDKLAEDRTQRLASAGQGTFLSRTSSIARRRDSAIPSLTTSTQASTYR